MSGAAVSGAAVSETDREEAPRLFAGAPELAVKMGDRGLFQGLDPLVYLNHAGISPPSVLVRKAVATILADQGKRGADAYPRWARQRARLREKLANLVNAGSPGEIALTQNTTRGISDVALTFPWNKGDRVVVFRGEFPSNVTPWLRAAELFSLEVVMLDAHLYMADLERALEALRQECDKGVRLLAVSAVEFQTGFRMPVEAMSKLVSARGGAMLVDAVQAMGVLPVDVQALGIDFLACGAHKWLMGIDGAGFLYARQEWAEKLVPHVAGWLSHESAVDFLFEGAGRLRYDKPIKKQISFLEGGNLSATAFAGLEASLDAILGLGVPEVFAHVQRFHDAVEPRAIELGLKSLRSPLADHRSGTLSFLPPQGIDVTVLHRELVALGIACALPDGCLRFAPHWPNAIDEAEQVLLSLEEALRRAR